MHRTPDRILGVFAKLPVAGQVKTRLAEATSPEWAERAAHAFLEDSLDRFAQITGISRSIVYTPATASPYFHRLAQDRFTCVPQCEGDLGERLRTFFRDAREKGYKRIVAVGTDTPTLPLEHIEQAFSLLQRSESPGTEVPGNSRVVIAPAFDGGYCLIGCGTHEIALFDDIPWSTSRVLERTVERVQAAGARLALLPPWYDVDTLDDWNMLCGHVRGMRQAGIDPGAPRVERLMEEATS
jgi:uncharacterized protein